MALFIKVEVDSAASDNPDVANKLVEVCPVNIFETDGDGALQIVEENLDECTLCDLCIQAAPPGSVRVIKLYDSMERSEVRHGGCLCGAVRFECRGAPSLVSYCHCRMCRKATGGPFSVMANFSGDSVTWSREPTKRRSSPFAIRGYCEKCGTPLSFQYDDSDHVSLSVGAFDDADDLSPIQHGGIESRLPWASVDPHLPDERTDDDPDYRHLVEQTKWSPPFGSGRNR